MNFMDKIRANGGQVAPLDMPRRPEKPRDPDTETVVNRILTTERRLAESEALVHELQIDNGFKDERIRQLEESLTEAERKRDLYQFHSTAFTIRLQDLDVMAEEQASAFRTLIREMLRQAKDEAFAPRETQVGNLPEAPGAAELAQKLAPQQDHQQE